MHPLLPADTNLGELVTLDDPVHGKQVRRDAVGNAGIPKMKLRVVCERCNNGWMNRLEGVARPYLTKMVKGQRSLLDGTAQLAVARWCVAKVIVAEHAPEAVPMTPFSDRERFALTLEIPDYYRVYVAAHRHEAQLGYLRRTSTISLDRFRPIPELDGMTRNVQQATFLMGKAIVHVNAARVEGFAVEDRFKMPMVHEDMRFWPPATDRLKWPGRSVLTDEQIRVLANSLKIACHRRPALWAMHPETGFSM